MVNMQALLHLDLNLLYGPTVAKHIERIEESKKRILLCKTLGVVGTGSLMGDNALAVQDIVSRKLGSYTSRGSHPVISHEGYAEMQFLISLIGSTLDR